MQAARERQLERFIGNEIDVQYRDGPNGSTRILPDGRLGGEAVQSAGAATTPFGSHLSPRLEASPHDRRPGGQQDDHD